MKNQPLDSLLADGRFIEGMEDYCDRWCDRCRRTEVCRQFAYEALQEAEKGKPIAEWSDEEINEAFAPSIDRTLDSIREGLEELGIDVEIESVPMDFPGATYLPEPMRPDGDTDDESFDHPLIDLAEQYAAQVNHWFEESEETLMQGLESIRTMVRMGLEARARERHAIIGEALQTIEWYQYLMAAKLYGVLAADWIHQQALQLFHTQIAEYHGITVEEVKTYPHGSHDPEQEWGASCGNVKTTLIGIDRSIDAWKVILTHFSEIMESILPIVSLLERLRSDIEEEFPDARGFVRPGLDE